MTLRIVGPSTMGTSTLDILVALSISSIVLLAISTVILHSLGLNQRLSVTLSREEVSHRFAVECLRLLQRLDTHRLPIPPRIHPRGHLTFTDGSENPISRSIGPTAPSPTSDAITALELAPTEQLTVLQASTTSPYQYYACRQGQTPLPASVRSYVGLSADGMFELVGSRQASTPGCWTFVLSAQVSMSVPRAPHGSPALVRTLIPVLSHYTLYVNRRNELRYLGHRGGVNDENQPLIADIGELSLHLSTNAAGLFSLAARRRIGPQLYTFSHTNLLVRLPLANILLTRP